MIFSKLSSLKAGSYVGELDTRTGPVCSRSFPAPPEFILIDFKAFFSIELGVASSEFILPERSVLFRNLRMKRLKWNRSVGSKHYLFAIHCPVRINSTNTRYRNLETLSSHSFESISYSDALQLFDERSTLNHVSATSIIGQFVRRHRHKEALSLFSAMLGLDCRPNEFTFGTVVHSATAMRQLHIGKQIHACSWKMGLHSNVFVGSALVDFYAKLTAIDESQIVFEDTSPNVFTYTSLIHGYLKAQRIEDALRVFRTMPEKNSVSWNAVIGGFSQTGHNEDALNLFIEMLRKRFFPTESTFSSTICAAANVAGLGLGRSLHGCAIKFLGKLDVFISNSLMSFYSKCGSMEDSLLIFDKLQERNIVSWNAIICGYGQNGRGQEAIVFFQKMNLAGVKLNSVTLLGLLWSCNHAGLVDEGYNYFNWGRMHYQNLLKPEHYACVVDLLSRSGRFEQAERFVNDLPFDPGIVFWKSLLGGCQIHSNMELGKLAANKILALDPKDVSSFVMLSNAHSAAGQWPSVSRIRREMKEKGLTRVPGCSWMEIRSNIHVFVTGDRNHQQIDEIYLALGFWREHLKRNEDSIFCVES